MTGLANLWAAYVLAISLNFFAQQDGSSAWIPFATITYTSTTLSFLTRSGLVSCPGMQASAGVFAFALFVSYWITRLAVGRAGIFAMEPAFPLHRDLTIYAAVPLDTFLLANARGLYGSFLRRGTPWHSPWARWHTFIRPGAVPLPRGARRRIARWHSRGDRFGCAGVPPRGTSPRRERSVPQRRLTRLSARKYSRWKVTRTRRKTFQRKPKCRQTNPPKFRP